MSNRNERAGAAKQAAPDEYARPQERRSFLARSGALLGGTVFSGCGVADEGPDAAARRARCQPAASNCGPWLPTTVRLSADAAMGTPGTELVTFGLPLLRGVITSTAQIRVRQGDRDIPIACKAGLRWHWKDGSLRSVTIQCAVDMSGGDVTLSIDGAGRDTAQDRAPQPVDAGWADSGYRDLDGRVLRAPRVYALHDLAYVAQTGLLPPYLPPATDDPSNTGIWSTANRFLGTFPYASTDSSAWLFDRPTTLFKLALQINDIAKRKALLKHAAVSKRHYFNYVVRTQIDNGSNWVVSHWWDFKRRASNPSAAFTSGTTMYQYCQGAKLALALLGDDTQWDQAMIRTWAADIRRAPGVAGIDHAGRGEYVYPAAWTERLAGLASLFQLNAWELTGDPDIRSSLDARVVNLQRHQQTRKSHEVENGWPASTGVFRHSWAGHDSSEVADYVMQAVQGYAAGATVIAVRSFLSDFDMPRFVGKGFDIGGTGAVDLLSCTKNQDGSWTLTLARPLAAAITTSTNIALLDTISKAPYVESDQAFSPWMSVFIADYLWQQHHLLGTAGIPEMLRRLGHALNERGFLSSINANLTFTRDVTNDAPSPWLGFNRAGMETYPLYLCSDLAPRNVHYHAGYTDSHTELLLPIAIAHHFETDPALRQRLEARIRKIVSGLFHESAVFPSSPLRLLNWQHQAMPLRTWKWVERRAGAST